MFENKRIIPLIYVTLFSLCWAIRTIITKIAVNDGAHPVTFSYQAAIGASIILFPIIVFNKNKVTKEQLTKYLPVFIVAGVLGTGLAFISQFYALKLTTAINFGFLIKSTLIFTLIMARIFLNEKISILKWFFALIIFIGAYLLSTKGKLIIPEIGDLVTLLAAFLLSLANIIAKPLLKVFPAVTITFIRTFLGGLVIFIISPFIIENFYIVTHIKELILVSILLVGTFYFLNKTLSVSDASYMTMMSMMYSVMVAIGGFLIFGETMSLIQLIGAILIILSVVIIQVIKSS
jgi:drug/metabolite transporter (DMT)-like permease